MVVPRKGNYQLVALVNIMHTTPDNTIKTGLFPTACCNYQAPLDAPYPVMWNPHNCVVQCHNCGATFWPVAKMPNPHKPSNTRDRLRAKHPENWRYAYHNEPFYTFEQFVEKHANLGRGDYLILLALMNKKIFTLYEVCNQILDLTPEKIILLDEDGDSITLSELFPQ